MGHDSSQCTSLGKWTFINYVDNQGEGGKTKAYVVNLSIIERKGTKNPVIVDYEWSQVVDSMHNFSLLDASFQIV